MFRGEGIRAGGRRRSLLLVAVLALVPALLALIAPPEVAAGWATVATTEGMNLRAEPGEWAPVVGTVAGGTGVEVLDGPTADGWYWVQTEGMAGWAAGGLLAFDGVGGGWTERWIGIDRSDQTVTLYEGDTPIATFWAAMGWDSSADGFFATAIGTYWVYEKTEGLTWTDWASAWITDWVGFDPSRVNGFHSFLKDENGWLIPGGDGPTGGCVALDPAAAEQLFWFAEVGMRVEVRW